MEKIAGAEFGSFLETNEQVVVDFYADWCGPCRVAGPLMEKVADKHPDVAFVKVDTDMASYLLDELEIRGIPTFIKFEKGAEVARVSGVQSVSKYEIELKLNG